MTLAVTLMVTTPNGIKKLHLIEIQNDGTGTPVIANYDVRLRSPDDVVYTCRVEDHHRVDSALWLAKTALEAITLGMGEKL